MPDTSTLRAPSAARQSANVIFRYHTRFLPEYVSAILVSLAINWIIVVDSSDNPLPTQNNPHLIPAALIYFALAGILLALTLMFRFKYPTVILGLDSVRLRALGIDFLSFRLKEIDSIKERKISFFGRTARSLEIFLNSGRILNVVDFIYDYRKLAALLTSRSCKLIGRNETLEDEQRTMEQRAFVREQVFDKPRLRALPMEFATRVFFSLPIFLVEGIISICLVHGFHGYDADYRNPYALYSAAISLAGGALAARYIYYYLLSSPFLNHRYEEKR